jgi:hypothetical protein
VIIGDPIGRRLSASRRSFAAVGSFAVPVTTEEPRMSPALPRPLERVTEDVFFALSSARRRRILHPFGVAYRIEVAVGDGIAGARAFSPGARFGGIARFSRGLGLPSAAPDFLGLALRLDADQDLLLATSAAAPGLRFAPRPARTFFGPTFTTLLPVVAGGRPLLVGARVRGAPSPGGGVWGELMGSAERGPVEIDLLAASPLGRWRSVARASTGERVAEDETRTLFFDPWRCGGGLVPWSWVNRVRAPAYRGSRRGREARRARAGA